MKSPWTEFVEKREILKKQGFDFIRILPQTKNWIVREEWLNRITNQYTYNLMSREKLNEFNGAVVLAKEEKK